jgi:hypothetical protein
MVRTRAEFVRRYCLPLTDPRPLQQSERQFCRFIRDKGIPLVFVLTKFDALIGDKLNGLAEDYEDPTPEERARARREAKDLVVDFRNVLESAVGRGLSVQEVSNKKKGKSNEAAASIYSTNSIADSALVQRLVAETTAIVKPSLRNVWMRAQGVLAAQKRLGWNPYSPWLHTRQLTGCL